jgi:hypothetical protein
MIEIKEIDRVDNWGAYYSGSYIIGALKFVGFLITLT